MHIVTTRGFPRQTALRVVGKVRPGNPNRGNHQHKLSMYFNLEYNAVVENLIVDMLFKTFPLARLEKGSQHEKSLKLLSTNIYKPEKPITPKPH